MMNFVVKLSVAEVFGLLLLGVTQAVNISSVHAQGYAVCARTERSYIVISGDTLSRIAARYGVSRAGLASHNHIASADLIYRDQLLCIPGSKPVAGVTAVQQLAFKSHSVSVQQQQVPALKTIGSKNPYPYGQCTWWADQRYFQLHHVYVPWTVNANAWQWTARAYEFGWTVSSTPKVGAIMDMRPLVQ